MTTLTKILIVMIIATIYACNAKNKTITEPQQQAEAQIAVPKDTNNSQRYISENGTVEYLKMIYGAISITQTVLGHYKMLDSNEVDEDELVKRMTRLCRQEKIGEKPVELIQQINNRLNAFHKDRDQEITEQQFDSTKQLCSSYVKLVLASFPCFKMGGDGQYYYQSNE